MTFRLRQRLSRLARLGGEGSRPLLLLAGLLLAAVPAPVPADAISELPPSWQERLQSVPDIDIAAIERVAREAIGGTRNRLSERLQDETSDTVDLAEGYGQLAALYQLYAVDSTAALCWENARRLQPGEFRWTYYAGYLALKVGQTDKALALLRQARELNPDYAPVDLRIGQLWLESDELDKAQTALEKAATEPGLRAAALYYLGQIDLLRRNYQGAADRLSEALSINPQATEVHYPLAQAYRRLGKTELAQRHLAQFKESTPVADDPLVSELETVLQTSRADFSLGVKAIGERDYEGAIQRFRQGLAIDPDNLAARVSYARALYLGGQNEAAAEQLHRVLERDPNQTLARFLLAVVWQSQGDSEKASEQYRRILNLDAEHQGARYYLANLLFEQGRFQEAATQYGAALAINPDIPPARLLQLIALHRTGRPDRELAQDLEKLIRAYPDQPELKYALVRLSSLSQDSGVRDSVRALTLANQLAPEQPTPPNIQALALAAAADGQFEQAARLQQQVIQMLGWMAAPQQVQALKETLAAYEKGVMPQQSIWPADDPLLSPGPLNPAEPFREYPTAVPF